MNANEILKEVGKDLSDTEQKFLKVLAAYQNEGTEGKEAGFRVMDCAFDLFCALEALAHNHNAMKAKILKILEPEKGLKDDLQRV